MGRQRGRADPRGQWRQWVAMLAPVRPPMAIAEATPGWADDSAAVLDYRHLLAAAGYCLREK
eukprot:13098114-Alexandrium_andersonii.AAC.1